ncbi:MAG: histidine phosphatase family protein, partial [bacterium]
MSLNGLTRVYLVRHGETVYHGTGKIYGQMDIPLSPRGEEQSRELAGRLKDKPSAAVISSDLQRASVGAKFLADGKGIAMRIYPEFRER